MFLCWYVPASWTPDGAIWLVPLICEYVTTPNQSFLELQTSAPSLHVCVCVCV